MANFSELVAKAQKHEQEARGKEDQAGEAARYSYREALAAYHGALALEPDNVKAKFDVGRVALLLLKLLSNSEEDIDDEDEDEVEAEAELVEDAVKNLRAVLASQPDNVACMYYLAIALSFDMEMTMAGMEEEEDDMDEDEAEEDSDDEASNTKQYENARKEANESCELIEKVVELVKADPSIGEKCEPKFTLADTLVFHAEALRTLASVTENKDEYSNMYSNSITKLEAAIAANPEKKAEYLQLWASTLRTIAERAVWESEGNDRVDYNKAMAKLEEAIAADPKDESLYRDRASMLMSSCEEIMMRAAMSMAEDEDDVENLEEFSAQIKLNDEDQKAVEQLSEQAIAALEQALKIKPESNDIAQLLSDCCITRARLQISKDASSAKSSSWLHRAEELLRAGISRDAEDEEMVVRLALVKFLGDKEDKEVDSLLNQFKELGGCLEDLCNEPEVFDDLFIVHASKVLPSDDSDDSDSY